MQLERGIQRGEEHPAGQIRHHVLKPKVADAQSDKAGAHDEPVSAYHVERLSRRLCPARGEKLLESTSRGLRVNNNRFFDPAYAGSWYGGALGKNQARMDTVYKSVLSRFRATIRSGVVKVHRNTSAESCSQFPQNYFDWIYIDGNHQYEFVKLDLEMFLPKVKMHGLVAGDDYGSPGWWQDGVTKAVDEAVASGRFEKLLIENHQFLLRKL